MMAHTCPTLRDESTEALRDDGVELRLTIRNSTAAGTQLHDRPAIVPAYGYSGTLSGGPEFKASM